MISLRGSISALTGSGYALKPITPLLITDPAFETGVAPSTFGAFGAWAQNTSQIAFFGIILNKGGGRYYIIGW